MGSTSTRRLERELRLPKKQVPSEKDQSAELKRLLELRKAVAEHRPEFVRPESWRYFRLRPNWRKPKGLDNKVRKSKKGWPRRVKVGYRGPVGARYLHSSGHSDVLVHNQNELTDLVPGRDVVRLGRTVGARKRAEILKRAKELGLVVVNPRGLRVIEPKK
jgi:large subunit ribosomal protein L32e